MAINPLSPGSIIGALGNKTQQQQEEERARQTQTQSSQYPQRPAAAGSNMTPTAGFGNWLQGDYEMANPLAGWNPVSSPIAPAIQQTLNNTGQQEMINATEQASRRPKSVGASIGGWGYGDVANAQVAANAGNIDPYTDIVNAVVNAKPKVKNLIPSAPSAPPTAPTNLPGRPVGDPRISPTPPVPARPVQNLIPTRPPSGQLPPPMTPPVAPPTNLPGRPVGDPRISPTANVEQPTLLDPSSLRYRTSGTMGYAGPSVTDIAQQMGWQSPQRFEGARGGPMRYEGGMFYGQGQAPAMPGRGGG
jgi:hypothetical protein